VVVVVVVEDDGVAAAPRPSALARVLRSACRFVAYAGVMYPLARPFAIEVATPWRSLAAACALPDARSVTACCAPFEMD